MYLIPHLISDNGRRLFIVQEELEQFINNLIVEFDWARHGPLELPQEQLQQLVGLNAHLALIVVRSFAVYVDQELLEEFRDTRKDVHVLDWMQQLYPFDKYYNDFILRCSV